MFEIREDRCYNMPVHFCGEGSDPTLATRCEYKDSTTMWVGYMTDAAKLEKYLPSGFKLLSPMLSVSYVSSKAIDWMAGGYYNLVDVSCPVAYVGNNEGLTGSYTLVIWEDATPPILGGREGCGMPKIFADIEELRMLRGVYSTNASYYGRTFFDMEVKNLVKCSDEEIAEQNKNGKFNVFGWRYIANMGRTPGAAVSHATLYPQETFTKEQWRGEGTVDWTVPTWQQNHGQAHIIQQIADMPNLGYVGALLRKNELYLMPGDARQLP